MHHGVQRVSRKVHGSLGGTLEGPRVYLRLQRVPHSAKGCLGVSKGCLGYKGSRRPKSRCPQRGALGRLPALGARGTFWTRGAVLGCSAALFGRFALRRLSCTLGHLLDAPRHPSYPLHPKAHFGVYKECNGAKGASERRAPFGHYETLCTL